MTGCAGLTTRELTEPVDSFTTTKSLVYSAAGNKITMLPGLFTPVAMSNSGKYVIFSNGKMMKRKHMGIKSADGPGELWVGEKNGVKSVRINDTGLLYDVVCDECPNISPSTL